MYRRWGFLFLLLFSLGGCGLSASELNNGGNRQFKRGSMNTAIRSYQLAQVANPDETLPYFNAGVAFLEKSEWSNAEAAFVQAYRHVDDEVLEYMIFFGLGEAYFRQTKYRLAAESFRRVLELQPDDEDARYNMELSLLRIPTDTPIPSPTPTTTSTDSVSPMTSTPTPSPSPTPEVPNPNGGQPTPTPEPQNDEQEPSPQPTAPANDEPPMDQMDAMQLLDDVQQGQGVIQSQLSPSRSSSAPIDKDW